MSSPVTPFFWFDTQAEEAAQFSVDLFEDSRLNEWIGGPDEAGRNRAMQAMLAMVKFDVAALQAAYEGADA
jgi:predicted 3-demethylubiquinone-9 3-methyltransferase (glyoxalase superfamily)